MSDIDFEFSEEEVIETNVQLVITMNNELIKIITNLQKMNNELCKMVSNINNVSYMVNKKIDDIQRTIYTLLSTVVCLRLYLFSPFPSH